MKTIIIIQIAIVILIFGGWTMNLIKLIDLDFEAPYKAEVIRTAGIIPPVGAIVGWIEIKDE